MTRLILNINFSGFMPALCNIRVERQDTKMSNRHGKDTIYFRTNEFTFIVQNGILVTVEISDSDMRHLNKSKFMMRLIGRKI